MTQAEALRYAQVAALIEQQIGSGTLAPGDRLPSLRAMSRHAGVSIGTVVQAYAHLEDRGLVGTRPRSGYFVSPPRTPLLTPPAAARSRARRPREVSREVIDLVLASFGRRDLVALNSAIADSATRVNGRLNGITRGVLRALPGLPNEFIPPPGLAGLRREVARRMALVGLEVEPDDIVITSGTMEAVALSLGILCRAGDTVLVETPTYFGILQLLEHLQLKAAEVPNHADRGIDVEALKDIVQKTPVAAALFQSSFNNPTGASTPDAAKQAIVEVLARHDIPIIEDDIYGDLHFGRDRPRPFGAFDTTGSVITCGSISKSVALGYRIGWAISPRHAVRIARAKFCSSVASPTLQQHVVARYLAQGTHDRHLVRVRATLRDNCQRFIETIASHFPAGTRASSPAGGVVLWLELPPEVDSVALFQAALAHRIGIAPGIIFSAKADYRNFVRLSAGVRWGPAVAQALRKLGRLAAGQ